MSIFTKSDLNQRHYVVLPMTPQAIPTIVCLKPVQTSISLMRDDLPTRDDNPVTAIDHQKLVRSVLQRIANFTGDRIYSTDLSNGSNFVDPKKEDSDAAQKTFKHRGPISRS